MNSFFQLFELLENKFAYLFFFNNPSPEKVCPDVTFSLLVVGFVPVCLYVFRFLREYSIASHGRLYNLRTQAI